MPPQELYECQTCSKHFDVDGLRDHLGYFQVGNSWLIRRMWPVSDVSSPEHASWSKSFNDACPTPCIRQRAIMSAQITVPDESASTSEDAETLRRNPLECPHPDCFDQVRTRYTKRNNLVRHYTRHVRCNEPCPFCSSAITDVRSYVLHYHTCAVKKRQEASGNICQKAKDRMIRRRQSLVKVSADFLAERLTVTDGGIALPTDRGGGFSNRGSKRRRTLRSTRPDDVHDKGRDNRPLCSGKSNN
ncbi:hypothetical protein TOPH_06161 [Tolypocladium ophioglossoides CBS 100239]|uniref:Uncharacterized protein n=1 Tax=Tolypocladium ophioglossoides (strain CBS 100239) TaxID=1163406 RepID=A0A0L0N5T0_TOLOC|nr:hypothetical protein TOPH_06161 [Tolypocladium ophioglossoides CBS 100239]